MCGRKSAAMFASISVGIQDVALIKRLISRARFIGEPTLSSKIYESR